MLPHAERMRKQVRKSARKLPFMRFFLPCRSLVVIRPDRTRGFRMQCDADARRDGASGTLPEEKRFRRIVSCQCRWMTGFRKR